MFSTIAERTMLNVRWLLLIGWLVLITSLFWDPFSVALTSPDNLTSPFRIDDGAITVQENALASTPYAMGARVFWTMILPLVPLFLMVFGHEAWRRICPLSLASQIPGFLGLRRKFSKLERSTGQIKSVVPLIDRNGWLERNSWYVQFGLLFAGVTARLVIINSDRIALAVAFMVVIAAAMLTGLLWGGKTWCNFFCPANVVQKIYTEPGGILESRPHLSRAALPQSMCRTPTTGGEVSACVGCKAYCGDIDLQRSYWNGVTDMPRRNVYYMFLGLIIGFYCYYYVYSGSWEYYFSGIWTHEDGVADKLFAPGFFLFGYSIAIPKIVAVPLFLALSCAAMLLIGKGLEAAYRRFRSSDSDISELIISHHCLSVCAWLSINIFYLFGGRPNILLLPPIAGRLIDIAIVALTTIWLWQVLQQSPSRYEQESLASGLLRQLKKLKLDVGKFLDNKNTEQLKPSEIYLLAKVLPGFSRQQKLEAYRQVLDEQISKGATATVSSPGLLADVRRQLDLTEEDHSRLLDELGHSTFNEPLSSSLTANEKTESLEQYRLILEATIGERLQNGATLIEVLADAEVYSALETVRQSLQISGDEHGICLKSLFLDGVMAKKLYTTMEALLRHKAVRLCLENADITDPLGGSMLELFLDYMESREQTLCKDTLQVMRSFPEDIDMRLIAEDFSSLAGPQIQLLMRQPFPSDATISWRKAIGAHLADVFYEDKYGSPDASALHNPHDRRWNRRAAITASLNLESNLAEILALDEPVMRAIGLTVFGYIDPDMARAAARDLIDGGLVSSHPLLASAAEYISGAAHLQDARPTVSFNATVKKGEEKARQFRICKPYITIGRAPDNDITITDPEIWTYHVALRAEYEKVRLLRLDKGPVHVNGQPVHEESVTISRRNIITLGNAGHHSPRVMIDWDGEVETGEIVDIHAVQRLAMLARNTYLRRFSHNVLANIAFRSKAERYVRGAKPEIIDGVGSYFVVHQGYVRLFDPQDMNFVDGIEYGPGDIFAFDPTVARYQYFPEVSSDFALLLHVPPSPEITAAASLKLVPGFNTAVVASRPTARSK
jgi:hypothetical protein